MGDFEGVHQAIETRFSGGDKSSDQPEQTTEQSAPQTQNQPQGNTPQTEAQVAQALELSKAEKFMIDGKEYTYDKLRKEMLLQQDYTRKTQEHAQAVKDFQKQKELDSHFRADLPKVLKNPELLSELAQHYPKEYVQLAREYLGMSKAGQQKTTQDQGTLTREEISELIKSEVSTARDQVISEQNLEKLNVILEQMKTKYPEFKDGRMERFVLSELQALASQDIKIDAGKIEETFQSLNEWLQGSRDSYHKAQLKKQSEANKKGSDMGAGGGTPGQAPQRLKLNQVSGALTDHLKRNYT